MTDTELKRREAICKVAGVDDVGEVSDGFHTFNGLYEQRMILFAALVKAYKDKSWKSHRHEDGEPCFGGGWFIVGIDTPKGSYTYHYEDKYWDMFECDELERGKHWDGHTEKDTETRLMSLHSEPHWIPCSERLPEKNGEYLCQEKLGFLYVDTWNGEYWDCADLAYGTVIAWMPLPESFKEVAE